MSRRGSAAPSIGREPTLGTSKDPRGTSRRTADEAGAGGASAALTVGERAVGKRPHCRRQLPGILGRYVVPVEVNHGVADDHGAAVRGAEKLAEVGVLSAAGFGGGGLGR